MRWNKENCRYCFVILPLASLSQSDLAIEYRRLIFCHARRLPAILCEMLSQHHDLSHMKRVPAKWCSSSDPTN